MKPSARQSIYGLMAEFDNPTALVHATRKATEAGYRKMDAYSPYPIEELAEALPHHRDWLPALVLAGGVLGLLVGVGLQYWASAIEYPMNVGGRPTASWPSFIPPAYETTILFAALAAVLGMVGLNGLPMPYHPVFNVDRFALASRNRFFLCIESRDPLFDPEKTVHFLESLEPREVAEVAH